MLSHQNSTQMIYFSWWNMYI